MTILKIFVSNIFCIAAYKASGHGREKGKEMLDNYLETKCVFVPLDGQKC
jgi:acyl-CoA reductase-like NAD-dependent aldehyde dehydrogenase